MTANLFHLLKVAVYEAYGLSLLGQAPEKHQRAFQFFSNYEPGQLVMEVSTGWADKFDEMRFGYFIEKRHEFYYSDEQWEEQKRTYLERDPDSLPLTDDDRTKEWRTYIKLLSDGREMRWTNCQFIRVPEELWRE
jgi:hypothetical protein